MCCWPFDVLIIGLCYNHLSNIEVFEACGLWCSFLKKLGLIGGVLLLFGGQSNSLADFSLDFQNDQSRLPGGFLVRPTIMGSDAESTCNRGGHDPCTTHEDFFLNTHCSWPGCTIAPLPDQTPMRYEMLVTASGTEWLHLMIGDPATGFAQDVYIRSNMVGADGVPSFEQSFWAATHNTGRNDDGGDQSTGPLQGPGNGSANPNHVMVRQVLGGTWNAATSTWSCSGTEFCSEFLKDTASTKPRIIQRVIQDDMQSDFMIDMRALNYQSQNGLNPFDGTRVVNSVVVTSSDFLLGDEGNFSIDTVPGIDGGIGSRPTMNVNLSAGQYTYTEGPATLSDGTANPYGAAGTYHYTVDNDFLLQDIDWCTYYHRSENNPYSSICQ